MKPVNLLVLFYLILLLYAVVYLESLKDAYFVIGFGIMAIGAVQYIDEERAEKIRRFMGWEE